MQQSPPRRYQRNSTRGKVLSIWLPPVVRARVETLADARNTSLSAIIVGILKRHFGFTTETDEEAA